MTFVEVQSSGRAWGGGCAPQLFSLPGTAWQLHKKPESCSVQTDMLCACVSTQPRHQWKQDTCLVLQTDTRAQVPGHTHRQKCYWTQAAGVRIWTSDWAALDWGHHLVCLKKTKQIDFQHNTGVKCIKRRRYRLEKTATAAPQVLRISVACVLHQSLCL